MDLVHPAGSSTPRAVSAALARRQIERIEQAFISSVSHELRTPLTSILGYVELMSEGAFGEITRDQREALEVVQRNGGRLLDAIDQILEVSLLDQTSADLTDDVDVSEVVEAAVGVLSGGRAGHVTSIDVEPGVRVRGDRMELATMVRNLVGNAHELTPCPGSIAISLRRSDGWALLEVVDSGVGVPSEGLELLLDRLRRGDQACEREIHGTGLGLALVRAIVHRHGGRMAVSSQVGVGSSFCVMLPIEGEEGR